MDVVVVESPAKARTIGTWLGKGYRVMATRGHVRDLPSKAGSVKPDEDFAMVYETGKRAARTLGAVAKALAGAEALVLGTDPDREGAAIAWQVLSWLEERDAIGGRPVRRVVFHEITPAAVRAALARPRGIDMDLWCGPGRRAGRSTTWWATASPRCCGASCRAAARRAGCSRWRSGWSASARPGSRPSLHGNTGRWKPRRRPGMPGSRSRSPGSTGPRSATPAWRRRGRRRTPQGGSAKRHSRWPRSSATRARGGRRRPSPPRRCSRRRRGVSASPSARPWRPHSGSTRASTSAARRRG